MTSVSEVADLLGISAMRVKQIIVEENLPHERAANKYISLPHGTIRKLLSSRSISYNHRTITFGIEKGGTGKSTISLLFSLYASYCRGARCALADLDAESSSTLFLAPDGFDSRTTNSLYEVYDNDEQIIDRLIPSRFEGVDFLPARPLMRRLNKFTDNSNPKTFLKKKMLGLKDAYDIFLFDVPPTFSAVVSSAYLASDVVVAVVNSDVFSLESLDLTIEDIQATAENFEAKAPEIKILRNKFQAQRRGTKETDVHLAKDYGRFMLPLQIKETAVISNAINDGINPFAVRKNAALKELFSDLFDSLIQTKEGR